MPLRKALHLQSSILKQAFFKGTFQFLRGTYSLDAFVVRQSTREKEFHLQLHLCQKIKQVQETLLGTETELLNCQNNHVLHWTNSLYPSSQAHFGSWHKFVHPTGILHGNMLFWELRESRSTNQDNAKPFLLYTRELLYKNLTTCANIHPVYRGGSKR